jgi:hypothetical protein
MTSIIDNMHDMSGGMPHRNGKLAGEAQRNAWLLQLEQAWMAKLGAHRSDAEQDGANSDPVREVVPTVQAHAVLPGNPVIGAGEHYAASADSQPNEIPDNSSSSDPGNIQKQVATPIRNDSQRPIQPGSEALIPAQSTAGDLKGLPVTTTSFSDTPPVSFEANSGNLLKGAMQNGEALRSSLAQSLRIEPSAVESAGTANTLALPATDPSRLGASTLWTALSGTEPSLSDDVDTSTSDDAPATRHKPDTEAAPENQYTARKLHLYQTGNSVQAWLRDANLSEIGVNSVAQALQTELQRSALQLTALTVNGKRLPFPSLQEEESVDTVQASTQGVASRHKTNAIQHIDKAATNNGGMTHGD